jgi:hypothetical protein
MITRKISGSRIMTCTAEKTRIRKSIIRLRNARQARETNKRELPAT